MYISVDVLLFLSPIKFILDLLLLQKTSVATIKISDLFPVEEGNTLELLQQDNIITIASMKTHILILQELKFSCPVGDNPPLYY